jgi:hypothetical protein
LSRLWKKLSSSTEKGICGDFLFRMQNEKIRKTIMEEFSLCPMPSDFRIKLC